MDSKALTESQRIARLFLISGGLISTVLVLLLLLTLLSGFIFDFFFFALGYVLPVPLMIWGVTLFVRYQRLLKNKLRMSEKRLWIETIIMNAVCLVFFLFMLDRFLDFPLTIQIGAAILNMLAIGFGLRALLTKEIAPT